MRSTERCRGLSTLAPSVALLLLTTGAAPALAGTNAQKPAAKSVDERRLELERRELELRKQELDLDQRRAAIEAEKQKIDDEAAIRDVITIQLQGEVLFDFGKSKIRPASETTLEKVAAVLKQFPDGRIAIVGHTDSVGSAETNLAVSKARAAAVREWLATKGGLGEKQIAVEGHGEAQPIAPNAMADGTDNPAGRQKNRRVEIKISEAEHKEGVVLDSTK